MNQKHFYAAVILLLFLAVGIQSALADSYNLVRGFDTYFGKWSAQDTIFTFESNLNPGDDIIMEYQTDTNIIIDGSNCTITGSNSSGVGVNVFECQNVTIKNLNVTGFEIGIWIQLSFNITLTNNSVQNNDDGIQIAHSYSNIDQGNTLTNNSISNNYWGIHLYMSDNNELMGNDVSDNTGGILLDTSCDENNLTNNTVLRNGPGIYLWNSSNNNTLTGNTASNNMYGIILKDFTCNNTLTGNNISDNVGGVYFGGIHLANCSNGNTIYHNNFNKNTGQAYVSDDCTGNDFNLSADEGGGNYWSDYTGVDTDGDGMGETPYTFLESPNKDDLPWVVQDGWFTPDTDGDGLSDDDEIKIYGTDPEDPDTDGDGLFDGTEVEMAQGTGCPDPLNPDSDGDTLLDGAEVDAGTNPCDADSDQDGIPDNIDPYPLDPEGTEDYIEAELRDEADFILTIDLDLFTGPNNNANKGRRGSLSNRANAAANQVANANYQEAIDILFSLLDRVDGVEPPKDWMCDSPEKEALEIDLMVMIELLGYYL